MNEQNYLPSIMIEAWTIIYYQLLFNVGSIIIIIIINIFSESHTMYTNDKFIFCHIIATMKVRLQNITILVVYYTIMISH